MDSESNQSSQLETIVENADVEMEEFKNPTSGRRYKIIKEELISITFTNICRLVGVNNEKVNKKNIYNIFREKYDAEIRSPELEKAVQEIINCTAGVMNEHLQLQIDDETMQKYWEAIMQKYMAESFA